MKIDIKVPAVGESISEGIIAQWMKKTGEKVKMNDVLFILETDKASVDVVAENEGVLTINAQEKQTVLIGAVVGQIDTEGAATAAAAPPAAPAASPAPSAAAAGTAPKNAATEVAPAPKSAPQAGANSSQSPAVRKLVAENDVDVSAISGTGKDGRVTKGDVLQNLTAAPAAKPASLPIAAAPVALAGAKSISSAGDVVRRVEMSTVRRRIAERLLEAQSTSAILTTFNEIDMSALQALRGKYKEAFSKKYGTGLGFMSFFTKAVIEALKTYPDLNASIEGNEIVYKEFYHIGIAVGTKRGLVVPVIRNADKMSMAEIEMAIRDFAARAEEGKIKPDEMSGGTFTITNGGTYGSLMSTPILNPPQSGILGMHKIEDRPVAIAGKVEIRPMMYVAMSYDHRLIDGSTSVKFLVKVKEGLEDPSRILIGI